jgi:multiple sugar transport system ATP-binding protein
MLLVREPEVFLFDEPLSNLDAMLRVQMRIELAKLHKTLKTTMIYVTHDPVEAMTLADRIVVLDRGTVAQVGAPLDLYTAPANKFVASFIGSPAMNFLPVRRFTTEPARLMLQLSDTVIALPRPQECQIAEEVPVEIGVRPEHVTIVDEADPRMNLRGCVILVERLGNLTIAYVDTDAGQVVVELEGTSPVRVDDVVGLALDPCHTHVFRADGRVV